MPSIHNQTPEAITPGGINEGSAQRYQFSAREAEEVALSSAEDEAAATLD